MYLLASKCTLIWYKTSGCTKRLYLTERGTIFRSADCALNASTRTTYVLVQACNQWSLQATSCKYRYRYLCKNTQNVRYPYLHFYFMYVLRVFLTSWCINGGMCVSVCVSVLCLRGGCMFCYVSCLSFFLPIYVNVVEISNKSQLY